MTNKKKILAIIGSASVNSSNLKLIEKIASWTNESCEITIYNDLKTLPHFDPELSVDNPPAKVIELRKSIEKADGIIFCTPEYIFSVPSGLKNAIEWCISTIVFSDKPTGIITASTNGQKGHEEFQLIMKTAGAKFTEKTCLLIQGIKGKFDEQGKLADSKTEKLLSGFTEAFMKSVKK